MLGIQSEKGGAGGGRGREGWWRRSILSGVLLPGASSIVADAEVGIGDGAHDALVTLTAQAPLTGTLVVNPIERLQRHRASGVTGWGRGSTSGISPPAPQPDPENPRPGSFQSVPSRLPRQGALWAWRTQVLVPTLCFFRASELDLSGEPLFTHPRSGDDESPAPPTSLVSCEDQKR